MDSSLDSIWDEPLVEEPSKRTDPPHNLEEDGDDPVRRPAKRPRQTLFLADSDSDEDVQASPRKAVQKAPPMQDVDIDALFADLDEEDNSLDFKPLPPRINEAELTRQAEERARNAAPSFTPHQILPSSSPQRDADNPSGREGGKKGENEKDEKKARRKNVKLDENLLLAADGFPRLIKMTKDFRIKGKGHEATDLNRLLQQYQYWTHSLYPKTPFRETVDRIEKLCHSRRMNVSLSVWRDEAHGRPHQKGSSDEDDIVQHDEQDNQVLNLPRSSPSRESSLPSGAASERNMPTQPQPRAETNAQQDSNREEDEEEDFWKSLDEFAGDISDPPPAPATAPNLSMDEDEDMWDLVNEIEQSAAKTTSASSNTVTAEPPGNPLLADEDEWEDMYL